MASTSSSSDKPIRLLELSAHLNQAGTAEDAADCGINLVNTILTDPIVSVKRYTPQSDGATTVKSFESHPSGDSDVLDRPPKSVLEELSGHPTRACKTQPSAVIHTDRSDWLSAEAHVPVGHTHILSVGTAAQDGFRDEDITAIEAIAANLSTALARVDRHRSEPIDCDIAQRLFEHSAKPMLVSNTDGELIAGNHAAREFTDCGRHELLGRHLPDMLTQDSDVVKQHLDTVTTGESELVRTALPRVDDEDILIELTSEQLSRRGATHICTTVHTRSPAADEHSASPQTQRSTTTDRTVLRRLNEITFGGQEFDAAIEELLSLGCDYLGLETGILSDVDGTVYEIEAVVDWTGTHEVGTIYDLEETMCQAVFASEKEAVLSFADVAETTHKNHPAAENVHAYIAAPVIVNGETHGTVNFSMKRPREEPFRQDEETFLTLITDWISTEIERRQRFEELKRYETILETVDDPVYALDTENRVTYLNDAAMREFGCGDEIIGEHLSSGRHCQDIEPIYHHVESLLSADKQSETATFELEAANGESKTVESRVGLISNGEFRGAAGVLRDITARKEREQRLESFQHLIEEAADGVAILEDQEYTYIDQTHVDMYGFEAKEELLGSTWRELYGETEIDRLESEAFPVLRAEGNWRGMVTGRRPDGSTFPTEISLTMVEGDRIVCTVRDETERQARERKLKQEVQRRKDNERQYRTLAENIPNAAVLTFDADLTYKLAAGELLSLFESEAASIRDKRVGTVLINPDHELIPRFRAAVNGERTDSQIELRGRILQTHIVPITSSDTSGLILIQDITDEAYRERELFEERERFRLLTESVSEYAFLIVSRDGTIQTWNESASNTFGYDTQIATGMSMTAIYPAVKRDLGVPDRLLQQAAIAGESTYEGQLIRDDGSEFYAEVSYAPLESDRGDFRGYAMVVHDLTDQRRQQRRAERLVEQSDDVITIVDTEGTITYASGSSTRILEFEPDALTETNLFDYLHPDSREDVMEAFFAATETHDATSQLSCRLRSGDGEWLNIELQYRNMLDDDAIGGMLVYLRDVTERKQRARRFEGIFNQTFQFTGLLDPDGTLIEVNDAALAFGGLERDAIVGKQFPEIGWWTHSEAASDTIEKAINRASDGEFVRYETDALGSDGLATIDFSVKPVSDEDGGISMLVVEGRNITARQQYRRNLDIMQRILRHNIRNDITKLRGWSKEMCEEASAEKRTEQFAIIESILDDWETMTDKVKQIRQVLQSQREQQADVEPASLVEDAVAPLRKKYTDTPITTETLDSVSASATVPATLVGAVRELVENAANAIEDGEVEVSVRHREDGWTEISIRDDGPGIPEMEATVLETGEETPLNHGGGLGLWMVRMIVTQAGGEVSVNSLTDGTEVCLRLPT